ncbi:mucin-21-like [Cherax quadricarinatus]
MNIICMSNNVGKMSEAVGKMKMVASEGSGGGLGGGGGGTRHEGTETTGTALSKLRHTLTSGIHGTVTKLSPTRPAPAVHAEGSVSSSSSSSSAGVVGAPAAASVSSEERSLLQKVWEKSERFDPGESRIFKPAPITTPTGPSGAMMGGGGGGISPVSSPVGGKQGETMTIVISSRSQRSPGSSCRVCVKTLEDTEFFKVCSECGNKVCEDCASYSTQASDGDQETWNCSICRRRLSSRARTEQPSSSEAATLTTGVPTIMSAPLPPPSPGAPTALNLFSGLAVMASSMAGTQQATTPSTPLPSPLPATSATTTCSTAFSTTPSTPTTTEPPTLQPTVNGYAHRKLSRGSCKQTSLDRAKSIEKSRTRDESRDRRTSTAAPGSESRRPRDRSRERPSVPRRRSDNDDDNPVRSSSSTRSTSVRRGRMSDYMLRDSSDDHLNFQRIHAAHSETDVSRTRKTSHANLHVTRPLDTVVARATAEDSTVTRESESSGDETLVVNSWQSRSRRRSIIRQQSYEEEDPDGETFVNHAGSGNNLTLWGGGDLPMRRHSAQDPSRRDDSLEGRKTRDSLDVPQHSRVHRHHSWDYDVARDTLPIGMAGVAAAAAASAGGSRHSSESDVSSEAPSERGSTTALVDEPHRFSRSSMKRRSSYRASRVKNQDTSDPYDADDQTGLESSSTPLSPEVAPLVGGSGGGGSGVTSAQSSPRRTLSSSLEDEQWLLHPEEEYRPTRRKSSAVSEGGRILPTPPASPRGTTGYPATTPTPTAGVGVPPRITQSLEVNTSRDLGMDDGLKRQSSVTEGETIRIVIHDVDIDHRKDLFTKEITAMF